MNDEDGGSTGPGTRCEQQEAHEPGRNRYNGAYPLFLVIERRVDKQRWNQDESCSAKCERTSTENRNCGNLQPAHSLLGIEEVNHAPDQGSKWEVGQHLRGPANDQRR